MGHDLIRSGDWILILLVIAGAFPELAATWQFLLVTGHFKELRGAEMTWDKTEKTGKVVLPG